VRGLGRMRRIAVTLLMGRIKSRREMMLIVSQLAL
jgi:hypothetical protein